MIGPSIRLAAVATAVASTLLFAQPALATSSVRTLAAEEAHLAGIADRMASANSALCQRPQMITGLILHDLTQYQPGRRAEVARAFSLGEGFGVLQMVSGGAAQRAGLRIDDEILAVGDVSVKISPAALQGPASFRSAEGLSDIFQSRLANGPADLLIRRSGQIKHITLTVDRGCGGELSLSNSSALNAWADGHHIVVSAGMRQFAQSDDEIAFVIAHEMAHNILKHFGSQEKMGIFGLPKARDNELDADGFAVRLMAAAGYQPYAGIAFLERSRRRLWWAFSLDHPGFGTRIRTVTAAISNWQTTRGEVHQASVQTAGSPTERLIRFEGRMPNPASEPVKFAQISAMVPPR